MGLEKEGDGVAWRSLSYKPCQESSPVETLYCLPQQIIGRDTAQRGAKPPVGFFCIPPAKSIHTCSLVVN